MASYTVSTLDDELFNAGNLAAEAADGNGLSLREAIGLANANTDSDAITFASGLAGGTVFLTSRELLLIRRNVSIDGDLNGDGTPDIAVSADSANGFDDAVTGVFRIHDNAPTTVSVTLNGLIIRDGRAASGGAISLGDAEALTITDSIITDNDQQILAAE